MSKKTSNAVKSLPKKNDRCVICKDIKTGKRVFINHHCSYSDDITIRVCRPCHNWLHGRAVYGHPFKSKYKPDKSPLMFAKAVVKAYIRSKK